MRPFLIKYAAIIGMFCLLRSPAPDACAEPPPAAPASTSSVGWPEDFAVAEIADTVSAVSHSPATPPPTAETNPPVATLAQLLDPTPASAPVDPAVLASFKSRLAAARNLITTRQFNLAGPTLVALLAENVPDEIRQTAMLNLGALAQAENDLPRAQAIFTQFLDRWPGDSRAPEILLRQGAIFRQMGLNNLALAKFYSVMTAALSLKNDQFANYQRLVLQAQVEIAETQYLAGRFTEAADFYTRLLKHIDNSVDRPKIQFRLIRSLIAIGRNEEAAGQAQDFLTRYPDGREAPETRYYLAQSLKAAGQSGEALRQVSIFLREQKSQTQDRPEVWAYWQQRVGNEIGNQLYKEGDYVKALEVYLNLSQLDAAPSWRLPVDYQVGLTYERLLQPQKAMDTYNQILARESTLGTNTTPGLKAVFDMARWRVGFIQWQGKAQTEIHSLGGATSARFPSPTSTLSALTTQ